jgi:hypothetical protein
MGDKLGTAETTEREIEILNATVRTMRAAAIALRESLRDGTCVDVENLDRKPYVILNADFVEGLAELFEAIVGVK